MGEMKTLPNYHTIGNRYAETRDLDIVELAKLVRKQLKKRFPKGYKFSVRTERGITSSLDIEIKEVPFKIVNPEWAVHLIDDPYCNKWEYPRDGSRYTPEANKLRDSIEEWLETYNFDNSDSMTDYFHSRFYSDVTFNYDLEKFEIALIQGMAKNGVIVKKWKGSQDAQS